MKLQRGSKKYKRFVVGTTLVIALCLPLITTAVAERVPISTEQDKIEQIISAGLAGKDAKFTFGEEYTLFLPVGVEVSEGIQLGAYAELYGAPSGLTSGRNGDVIDYSLAGTPIAEGEYQMLAVSSSNGDRHYLVKTFNIQVGDSVDTPLVRLYNELHTEVRRLIGGDAVGVEQIIAKLMYAILNDESIQNGYNRQSHGYQMEKYLQPLLAGKTVSDALHQAVAQYVQVTTNHSQIEGYGNENPHSVAIKYLVGQVNEFVHTNGQNRIIVSGNPQSNIVTLQVQNAWETVNYTGVFEHIPPKQLRVIGNDAQSARQVTVGTRLLAWDETSSNGQFKTFYLTKENGVGTVSVMLENHGAYMEYLLEQ